MSSDNEKAPLIQKHSGKMTTLAAFNTAFNVMLGTGPILVPPVFQQPGLILAFGFVVIITCLSFICAEFVIETMSLLTAIRARKEAVRVIEEESSSITDPNGKQIQNRADVNYQSEEFEDDSDRTEFHYKEGIEYGQMALEIFGKNGQAVVASVLVVYLVGVLSSKTIMIGTILSTAFSGVSFLDSRYTWIISFFTCSVLFSFKNVQSTKLLQNIIILVRFFTIASLLIGSIQVMVVDGIHSIYELHSLIDFGNFTSFFGDLQFALLLHHAIPSMFASIERQQDVKKVLFAAITIGSLSLLLLSIFGMLAFGQCLNSQTEPNCAPTYVNGSSYFNNFFKGVANTDWVFYISSFYIFLNIAAFPVLIITARNNLMKFVMPHKITPQINKWTVFFTVLITGPIITIALLTTNIQLVLDWISGIFGSMLISLFPSTFLIFARKQASQLGINYKNSLHKAYFSHQYLPYGTLLIGSGLLIFTLYNNFKKYT